MPIELISNSVKLKQTKSGGPNFMNALEQSLGSFMTQHNRWFA